MKQKPYNTPIFINKFVDKCKITPENFELAMNHFHLSVQPELTRTQEKELKKIEGNIFYLTTKLQIEKLNNCI